MNIYAHKNYYKYQSFYIATTTLSNLDTKTSIWCYIHISLKNSVSMLISIDLIDNYSIIEYIKSIDNSIQNIITTIQIIIAFIYIFFNKINSLTLNTSRNTLIISPDPIKNWIEYYFSGYPLNERDRLDYINLQNNIYNKLPNFDIIINEIPTLNSYYDIYIVCESKLEFIQKLKNIDINLCQTFISKFIYNDKSYTNTIWNIKLNSYNFKIDDFIEVDFISYYDNGNTIYKSDKHLGFTELYLKRLSKYKFYYT